MRNSIIATVAPFDDFLAIHFCNPKKLQGEDYNLWIPLYKTTDVHALNFEEVERIMTINHVAHNITLINKVRYSGPSVDYEIVFNVWGA